MGSRIRLIEPNIVYNATLNCIDRQFLFSPNHDPRYTLLNRHCPPEALDPNNDILPVPSTINIIGAAIGRAQRSHPVDLHFAEFNSDHGHKGLSIKSGKEDNFARFFQTSNSLIARNLNKQWDREGHFFSNRYRIEPCLDSESAEQKLKYAITNVVKDQLVERVSQSPYFSTYRHLAFGDELKYWYIDWQGYWAAGGPAKRNLRAKDFLKWVKVDLTPLPGWEELTIYQRQTRIRKMVQEVEAQAAEERRHKNRRVMGLPRIFAQDPRSRPETPKQRTAQPLCHCSDVKRYKEFRAKWREFRQEYRRASADYLDGYHEREFPEGSFKPPSRLKVYKPPGS